MDGCNIHASPEFYPWTKGTYEYEAIFNLHHLTIELSPTHPLEAPISVLSLLSLGPIVHFLPISLSLSLLRQLCKDRSRYDAVGGL